MIAGRPASVTPLLPALLVTAASVLVGVMLIAGLSPVSAIAITGAPIALALVLATRQVGQALLSLMFLVAPIDLAKALIAPDDKRFPSDAPGLSITPMDLAVFTWAACWLWQRLVVERRPIQWTRIDAAVLVFIGWIWVSALRSPAGTLALATALTYSKYVAMFWLLSHGVRSPSDWRLVLRASAVILLVQVVHVMAQMATGSPLALPGAKLPPTESVLAIGGSEAFRPMGFFNHPNALADYLVLVLPPALCLVMLGARRLPWRVWMLALMVLLGGGLALALTLSRGGWAAFALACLVCVFLFRRRRVVTTRQLGGGAVLAALVLATAVAAMPNLVLRLVGPDSRSLESRSLLAAQALDMAADYPLAGVGFGGYNRVSMDYTPRGFAYVSDDYQKVLRQLVVHNYYLLLAAELGVPAMVLFAGIFFSLMLGLRPLSRWRDPAVFALAVGLVGALAGNLLFLASDNYYADIRIELMWVAAGLLQALLLNQKVRDTNLRDMKVGDTPAAPPPRGAR